VIGFRELVSSQLADLGGGPGAAGPGGGAGGSANGGLELFDLEDDVGAFTVALPRIRVIPIERFDPWTLLS
jgi:putative heme uptake system protein